jgi:hypothetical protein
VSNYGHFEAFLTAIWTTLVQLLFITVFVVVMTL